MEKRRESWDRASEQQDAARQRMAVNCDSSSYFKSPRCRLRNEVRRAPHAPRRATFLLRRRGPLPKQAQASRTSVAFSLHANAPGALLQALEIFAARGLNMSRIESRPSKRELGEYVFFVDLEAAGQPVEEVCAALQPLCERLSCFGSYPITDDTVSP